MAVNDPQSLSHFDPFAADPEILASILDVAGVLVVILDPDGRIVYFNRTCEVITGYRANEVTGTSVWDRLLIPEEVEEVREVFRDLANTSLRNQHQNCWVTKSGERVFVQWFNTSVRNEDGSVRWVIGTGLDVTDKRQAQLQVEEQAARLKAVVGAAVDGIITIDDKGTIESLNPAAERLFGYAENELTGQNVRVLMPAPYREQHDTYITNYLRTGHAKIIGVGREVTGLRKDGSTFPVDLVVSEVVLPGGRCFTGMVRDISDRVLAEKRERQRLAEHAHAARLAALGEMASGIAHELNQPLAAIVSFADACQILIDKPDTPPAVVRDALGQISEQGIRAGNIIRRLRQFVRTGSLDREIVNLNAVTNDVIAMVAHEMHLNEIQVDLCLCEYLPSVWADKLQMEQVLLNLVRNAAEAMQTTSTRRIVIDTSVHEDKVRVRVSDTGCGLPKDGPEKVFDAFYTTKKSGTGLGLSISHSIIDAHGGQLGTQPAQHGGATFFFCMPIAHAID